MSQAKDPRYDERLKVYKRMHDNFEFYALNCLKIRPKAGDLQEFKLNKAQRHLHYIAEKQLREKGFVRIITVKGRQQGVSTYIDGRQFWRVSQRKGVRAFILTHAADATNNLFDMTKRFYDNCLPAFKPSLKASNAKELAFDLLDSGYKIGTAGNESVGRSSTIQYLHASEAAFYSHAAEHARGIMQTVPLEANTEVFIESTANGVGNWFHQQWQAAESGQSDFIAVFLPWFWQDEYRRKVSADFEATDEENQLKELYHVDDEQLLWRRIKITEMSVDGIDGNKLFMQEYPFNSTEAFQSSAEDIFITPDLVMRARKNNGKHIEAIGPVTYGVDVGRGRDRTAIARRQGRIVDYIKSYVNDDLMHTVGLLHNIIETEKPDKVFVDIGGIGAGVYDRLIELGHKDTVVGINSATSALNDSRFANKRSEMWALGREWLLDPLVVLPDIDELHGDFCNTKSKFDSRGRLLMESKQDMKKRGIRSSDTADAVLLTFAMPVSYFEKQVSKDMQKKASIIMHSMKVRQRGF